MGLGFARGGVEKLLKEFLQTPSHPGNLFALEGCVASVAQSGRASPCQGERRGFESLRSLQSYSSANRRPVPESPSVFTDSVSSPPLQRSASPNSSCTHAHELCVGSYGAEPRKILDRLWGRLFRPVRVNFQSEPDGNVPLRFPGMAPSPSAVPASSARKAPASETPPRRGFAILRAVVHT